MEIELLPFGRSLSDKLRAAHYKWLGMPSGLTPELASRLGLKNANAKGMVIQVVSPDGRAADAGLQAGDVIEQVNRQPVQSIDELRAAVKKSAGTPVLLLINRQGNNIFITVR